MSEPDKPKDEDAGKRGEDFVEWVCQSPLGKDFLFRGQKYRDGNNEIELCDLLLLLDDTAVLMEVKTADRTKRPNRTEQEWSDWANIRLKRGLSQIKRGVKAMRVGLVKEIENERQGRVVIDPSNIKYYFGIAVVDHPTLDKWGRGPRVNADGLLVSVLTTTHSELMGLFTELSTPGDLIDYLEARAEFFAKHMMMGITELDVLAVYKGDPDQFRKNVAERDVIVIGEGSWEEFAKMDGRKKRTEMDRPSLLVDAIIDKLHEGRHARLPHVEERRARLGQSDDMADRYAAIAAELSRIRRIDRRVIGEGLIEKSLKCNEQKRDRWFTMSSKTRDDIPCIFLVSLRDREERMKSLELLTVGALLKLNVHRALGIATEPVMGGHGFSVDAVLLADDPEEYRKKLPPEALDFLLKQFGTPRKPDVTEFGGLAGE